MKENNIFFMTEDEIEQWMEKESLSYTDDIENAIYITREGKLINGNFQYGFRDLDHRCVESLINKSRYEKNFWQDLWQSTDFIMLEPESRLLLMGEDQEILSEQQQIVENALSIGYMKEIYC